MRTPILRPLRWLVRPVLVRLSWWLTTHDGFYTPCDEDCCREVRAKARSL